MVVLIAPETDINDEIVTLNQLFKAGLDYFHLRKPSKNYKEHCAYLDQIDSIYHNRIVVHLCHNLMDNYDLKGIHFQEQKRREQLDIIAKPKGLGKTISSSFHELDELETCPIEFDYHLLSPVFSSISKKGYQGRGFDVRHINKKIVGMGGVTPDNLEAFTQLGYQGVGVLGGVWNSSSPIANFETIRDYFARLNV